MIPQDPTSQRTARLASRHRTLLSAAFGIGFLWLASPVPASLWAGAAIALAGEGVRIWASGHIDKNDRVTAEGPYSLSRNPLYVGNFAIGLGLVVAAARPVLVPAFLLFFALLYAGTIRYEELFLSAKFGDEYEAYRRATPRFFPFTGWGRYRPGNFRFRLVLAHREYWTWLGLGLAFLFLTWRAA